MCRPAAMARKAPSRQRCCCELRGSSGQREARLGFRAETVERPGGLRREASLTLSQAIRAVDAVTHWSGAALRSLGSGRCRRCAVPAYRPPVCGWVDFAEFAVAGLRRLACAFAPVLALRLRRRLAATPLSRAGFRLRGNQLDGGGIDAEAQAGRRRTIVENMPEMGSATAAHHLDSRLDFAVIPRGLQRPYC